MIQWYTKAKQIKEVFTWWLKLKGTDNGCSLKIWVKGMAWQWAETLVEIRGTLADIRGTTN